MLVQFLIVVPTILGNRRSSWFDFDSADKTGQNEDVVSDIQYILQTLTGIEDRLAQLEDSNSRQGKEI